MENNLKITILVVSGIVLPLILIPIIKFIGFPEIIEEVSKALIVFFLILELLSVRQKIVSAILFGFLFGLSENFFYLTNIFQVGDFSIFWQRFLWTVPMHIVACLIILLPALKNKKLIVLGLAGSITIHLLFNNFIAL